MKLLNKLALLLSMAVASGVSAGPKDIDEGYQEKISYATELKADFGCDKESQKVSEHIIYVRGQELIVKEIPASKIEFIGDGDGLKEGCLGFHGPGDADVKPVVTGMISNRRQLQVHSQGIRKRGSGSSIAG